MRYRPGVTEATGTQAIARGLVDGGVSHASAFPGSPATVLAQALEGEDAVEFRWSVNENTALSHAFGVALGGRGAVAIMKHVGINVALDALQVMGVVHTLPAPLVLIEGADARPGSSQSAQDNRPVLAGSPELLVLAPTTVQEAYDLTRAAIDVSRAFGMVVVVRGDARMFKATGPLTTRDPSARESPFSAWPGRGWALATSARTYGHHLRIRRGVFEALVPFLDGLATAWVGSAPSATIVAAHLGHEIAQALRMAGIPGLRLLVENPLPEARIVDLLRQHDRVAVLEECLPHLEHRVREIAQRHGLNTRIVGRRQLGDARPVGWLTGDVLDAIVERLSAPDAASRAPGEPTRGPLPGLPAGLVEGRGAAVAKHYEKFEAENPLSSFPDPDPRKAAFELLRALGQPRATFVATDPGITGVLALGGAMTDVKMHMGSAVPIAAGWSRAHPDGLAIAVVGDTNLPHSEWLGLVESAAAGDDLLVVVADNGHSEMTQRIVTLRPSPQQAMASLAALGIWVKEARATSALTDPWTQVLREAASMSGTRLVWLHL